MRFFYGFVGAILGAIVGGATTFFVTTVSEDGDQFGIALTLAFFGFVGVALGIVLGIVVALLLLRYVKRHQESKRDKRKNVLIISGCVIAVPLLVAAMLWDTTQYGNPPPDQQLLSNFDRHKATFNALSQMVLSDKNLTRVDYNWTEPNDPQKIGVPPDRIAKYRNLLDSIGLHRGFSSDGVHSVEFISYGQGSAMSSDTFKGYMYLAAPPKQVLNTLDNCQPDEKNGVEAYRHIEGHWYLYYKYLPG